MQARLREPSSGLGPARMRDADCCNFRCGAAVACTTQIIRSCMPWTSARWPVAPPCRWDMDGRQQGDSGTWQSRSAGKSESSCFSAKDPRSRAHSARKPTWWPKFVALAAPANLHPSTLSETAPKPLDVGASTRDLERGPLRCPSHPSSYDWLEPYEPVSGELSNNYAIRSSG